MNKEVQYSKMLDHYSTEVTVTVCIMFHLIRFSPPNFGNPLLFASVSVHLFSLLAQLFACNRSDIMMSCLSANKFSNKEYALLEKQQSAVWAKAHCESNYEL